LKIGVKTKPTGQKDTYWLAQGSKDQEKIKLKQKRMFSAEILPTSACERNILNLESNTNPKRTSETQQMFTIISLLI
jgi:hypothetical protein